MMGLQEGPGVGPFLQQSLSSPRITDGETQAPGEQTIKLEGSEALAWLSQGSMQLLIWGS